MVKSAKKTAILTISEKLNSSMRLKIADMRDISYLITELNPKSPILEPYAMAKYEVVTASGAWQEGMILF